MNYDKEEEIEKEMTRQNQGGAKMGTKTTTKRVASMSPQECVRHKQLKAIKKDRSVGVGGARQTWQIQMLQPKKERE